MILQLIIWLAMAIHGGSTINGCLTDSWQGHNAVIRVGPTIGVVTTAQTRSNTCTPTPTRRKPTK